MEEDRIIFLDTETTGLYPDEDEILELAIVDIDGKTLFNKRFKPEKLTEWPDAEAVHGISPDDLKDEKPISFYRDQIVDILLNAEMIVGYNTQFDMSFLEKSLKYNKFEENLSRTIPELDIMRLWAAGGRWQKLTVVAEKFNYEWVGEAHGALADTLATLHIYKSLKRKKGFKQAILDTFETCHEYRYFYLCQYKYFKDGFIKNAEEIDNVIGWLSVINTFKNSYIAKKNRVRNEKKRKSESEKRRKKATSGIDILHLDVDKYLHKHRGTPKIIKRRNHQKYLFTKTQIKKGIKNGEYKLEDFEIFAYSENGFTGYDYLLYMKKTDDKQFLLEELTYPYPKLKKARKLREEKNKK